jgi:hypothetical protein
MSRHRRPVPSRIALGAVLAAGLLGLLPASASAARTVTFASSFSPDARLGEGATFTSELTLEGTEYHGYVDPLTGLTIHLPAGIGLSSSGFPTCSKETIEQFGLNSGKCPAGSLAGPAGALTALLSFTETVEEHATVQPAFGPGGVLYFVVEGHTPVELEYIMEGHFVSDSPPYGQALVLQIPLIETVPHSPDESITALTLSLGTSREEGGTMVHSVTLPSECLSGTFAWAAGAAFNGGASEPVAATETACPIAGHRIATTTTLNVSNIAPLLGETVTYTATVTPTTPGGAAPSGNVEFVDETVPIEGCKAQPLTPGASSSTATCQVSYSAYGVHGISASYGGDVNYVGSASLTETVTLSSGTEEALHKRQAEEAAAKKRAEEATDGGPLIDDGGVGAVTNPGISSAQIAALLGQQLIPSGKAARITVLLKSGGLTMSFKALEAGTLVVGWYELPPGAKLAMHTTAKPVLVAYGQMTFAAAGAGTIKVKLTAAGKRLLKHAKRLKLTAKGVFTPSGGAGVGTTKGFVVSH